jgi:CubicO group peptidase (beta-lactamase class C family)
MLIFNLKRGLFLILFISFALSSIAQTYFPPKTGTWDTLSIDRLGYCQERIDSLYNFLEKQNSKSFILLYDGKIVLEKYFGTFTKDSNWYWASAGKTLTGFCVGIAQAEGKLKITDQSSKYLGSGWTSLNQTQEDKITIWNQLSMTTGLKDNVADPDCTLPACLQYADIAGNRWAYHNAPYTLLDKVIESATGSNLNFYVYQKIANPIGMKGLYFKSGYNNIYGSDSRSMARFGLLLLNKGVWNGTLILKDTNYFKQMTNSSQTINKGYGYLTWLNGKTSYMAPQSQLVFPGSISPDAPNDVLMALGKNGQVINVSASKGLVWIRMGNEPINNGLVPWIFNNEIWKNINQLPCAKTNKIDFESEKLGLFPNIARSGEMVFLKSKCKDVPQIFNSLWQSMKVEGEFNAEGFLINTKNMPSGIYLVKIKNGQTIRMVLQ